MGLFDFLKTKGQSKMQQALEGIHKEIFPNGHEQVEKEVQEVRELLEFKYTKEEIKSTYFHAAAIFYVDKGKQKEEIVSSILCNRDSAVTRNDAAKIYEYLKKKFGISTVQSLVSEVVSNLPKPNALFMVAKGGIVEIKQGYKDLTDKGKFEVLLFNSSIALRTIREKYPMDYQSFQQKYVLLLVDAASAYKIEIPVGDLMNLMNSRIGMYVNETHQLMVTNNYKAYKIFNCFYQTPLSNNPSSESFVPSAEYDKFLIGLLRMIKWMFDKTKLVS